MTLADELSELGISATVLQLGEDEQVVLTLERPLSRAQLEHLRDKWEQELPEWRAVIVDSARLEVRTRD